MKRILYKQSLLDRLIGEEAPSDESNVAACARFRRAVHRDLELMLNARQNMETLAGTTGGRAGMVASSLPSFGMPDFARYSPSSPSDMDNLAELFRSKIEAFEPRVANVEVQVMNREETSGRLRLRASGTLQTWPVAVPVVFDAEVDTAIGRFELKAD